MLPQGVGPVYAKKIIAERASAPAGEVAFKAVSSNPGAFWGLFDRPWGYEMQSNGVYGGPWHGADCKS